MLLIVGSCASAYPQACTPQFQVTCTANLNLWVPQLGYLNWQTPVNDNTILIDSASANWAKLSTANTFTANQTFPDVLLSNIGSSTSPLCTTTGGLITNVGCVDAGNVTGSGTTGYISAWTGSSAIGNSHLTDGLFVTNYMTSLEGITEQLGGNTAVTSGTNLFLLGASGNDTSINYGPSAAIGMAASQNWSSTAHGTGINFYVTPNVFNTLSEVWNIQQDGGFTAYNQTDYGNGTLSSQGLFGTTTGTFSNIATNISSQVTTNTSSSTCNQLFYNSGQFQYATSAFTSCITGPATSPGGSFNMAAAGNFFAVGGAGGNRPVALYAVAFAEVNGQVAYGFNPVAEDVSGLTTGVVLTAQENDVLVNNATTAYAQGYGVNSVLYSPGHNGGTFPFYAYDIAVGTGSNNYGQAWEYGLNSTTGAIGSGGSVMNINALGTATSGANYNCPNFLNIYEAYWNGSAAANEGWSWQCNVGSGTNPGNDYWLLQHNRGTSPGGQTHYFGVANNIDLAIQHSDGSTWDLIAASAATGANVTYTLGSEFPCTHGAAGTCGVATLASGTVTVSTTAAIALASSGGAGGAIRFTLQNCSSCGILSVGTVSAGISFVINSSNGSDASKVFWEIVTVN